MKKLLFVTMMATIAMPMAAYAQKKEKIETPIESEIAEFCEDVPKPAQRGKQYNGEDADPQVLLFRAGDYELDFRKGVWLWLYHDGSFYVNLSRRTGVSFGSDGDDLIEGRLIGGCSREQLSEILRKNDILDIAKEHVPEDQILREELEAIDAAEQGIELKPKTIRDEQEDDSTLRIPDNEYKPRMRGMKQ